MKITVDDDHAPIDKTTGRVFAGGITHNS
jgi:hypothetical protein